METALSLKIRTILLLGILLFASCEKNKNEDSLLIGIWEWDMTTGGWIGNNMYTPENTGITETLVISLDSYFKKYVNDTLTISSKFEIRTSNSNAQSEYIDLDSNYQDYWFRFKSRDTLIITSYSLTDDFDYYYHRLY